MDDIVAGEYDLNSDTSRILIYFGGGRMGDPSTRIGAADADVIIEDLDAYDDGEWLGSSVAVADADGDGCEDVMAVGIRPDTYDCLLYGYRGSPAWDRTITHSAGSYTWQLARGGDRCYLDSTIQVLGPIDGDIDGDGVMNDADRFLALESSTDWYDFQYILLPLRALVPGGEMEAMERFVLSYYFCSGASLASGDFDGDGWEDLAYQESCFVQTGTVYWGPLSSSDTVRRFDVGTRPIVVDAGYADGEDVGLITHGLLVGAAPLTEPDRADLLWENSWCLTLASGRSLDEVGKPEEGFFGYTADIELLELAVFCADGAMESVVSSAEVGDFNGDGAADLAMASPVDFGRRGAVWVHRGVGPADLEATWTLRAGQYPADDVAAGASNYWNTYLGLTMESGDLTGDGLDDLVVSSWECEEWFGCLHIWPGSPSDDDGDGYPLLADLDGDGDYETLDCDDDQANTHPGAMEVCDYTSDNDCDGMIDEDVRTPYYQDADGDGFGDSATQVLLCTDDVPGDYAGWVLDGTDCHDADAGVFPGAPESCDGADQDCDGVVDDGLDGDGDGWTPCAGDCHDGDPVVHPGAPEACDGRDGDCDGVVDAAAIPLGDDASVAVDLAFPFPFCGSSWEQVWVGSNGYLTFGGPSEAYAEESDFDLIGIEGLPAIAPFWDDLDPASGGTVRVESCTPGRAVIEWTDVPQYGAADANTFTVTMDATGWVTTAFGAVAAYNGLVGLSCAAGVDRSEVDLSTMAGAPIDPGCATFELFAGPFDIADLDGLSLSWHREWAEVCDGIADNDCDGVEDPREHDADADGWTPCAGDCDDADPASGPASEEVCDGLDNDCDGAVDDGVGSTWYVDADGDGHGDPGTALHTCGAAPGGTVSDATDCDDADPGVHPGAAMVCDGVLDNDCDGAVDPPEADADGDGFTPCSGDCDDTRDGTHPGAEEVCDDAVDNDCDGLTDDLDGNCMGGDDDSTPGDDDSTPGDDDSTPGDDDSTPGDDDATEDDDVASDDDSEVPSDGGGDATPEGCAGCWVGEAPGHPPDRAALATVAIAWLPAILRRGRSRRCPASAP